MREFPRIRHDVSGQFAGQLRREMAVVCGREGRRDGAEEGIHTGIKVGNGRRREGGGTTSDQGVVGSNPAEGAGGFPSRGKGKTNVPPPREWLRRGRYGS